MTITGCARAWWSDNGEPLEDEDWALAQALSVGVVSFNQRLDIERYDGTRGAILNSASPILDANGSIVGGVVAVVDITPQREAERALRESEARYRAVWDASFDARLLHDFEKVLDVNQSFVSVFGYSQDEVIGKDGSSFLLRPEIGVQVVEQNLAESERVFELPMHRKDGIELLVATRARNLIIGGKQFQVVAFNDITAQREAAERALALELEKARLRMITSLIQSISHDFRTPLSTINTSLYLLERLTEPERRREKAATIEAQVQRLMKLIESMLMMTSINSGLPAERHPVDIYLLLQAVHARLKKQAEHKGVALHLQASEQLPLLPGDEGQLEALVSELILNGIQFTPPEGSVWVYGAVHDQHAVIEVRDTGVGIPLSDRARIFEAFYRVDTARGTDTGGIGLGLAIAQKIVELHDGHIEVESTPGNGSSFRVVLPLPAVSFRRAFED